jgi:hypothetical protein
MLGHAELATTQIYTGKTRTTNRQGTGARSTAMKVLRVLSGLLGLVGMFEVVPI